MMNGKVVALGDYSLPTNCVGADRFKNGKRDIIDGIIEAYSRYNPNIIIYEHMISSTTSKGTKEISKIASAYGYNYVGVQLSLSDEKRLKNLRNRSGENAGEKRFDTRKKIVESATERLNKEGVTVSVYDVENLKKEEMWKVVDFAIRKADV